MWLASPRTASNPQGHYNVNRGALAVNDLRNAVAGNRTSKTGRYFLVLDNEPVICNYLCWCLSVPTCFTSALVHVGANHR